MMTPATPRTGSIGHSARSRFRRLAQVTTAIVLGSWATAAVSAEADVSGPQIVGYVNAQRAAQGIPANIANDAALTTGCANHNAYGRMNNVLVHEEDPALAGYTASGNAAAQRSVL